MTATPESWDDVGSLRIQVECISQKYGLSSSELQNLKDKINAQDQKQQNLQDNLNAQQKEIRQMKRSQSTVNCMIVIAVSLGFVFAVQMMHISWESKSIQMQADGSWKMSPANLESSEGKAVDPRAEATNRTRDKTMKWSNEEWRNSTEWSKQEWSNATKLKVGGQRLRVEEKPKPRDELEVQSALHLEANASEGGPNLEKGSIAVGESAESIEGDQGKISSSGGKVLRQSSKFWEARLRGVFYVCFPASARNEYMEKYANVFNKVAGRQKWMVYPSCYVETGEVRVIHIIRDKYGIDVAEAMQLPEAMQQHAWIRNAVLKRLRLEEFCGDTDRITFVIERSQTDVLQSNEPSFTPNDEIPAHFEFEHCEDLLIESPKRFELGPSEWFTRVLPQGQDIQASTIEEFVSDVYSGKIQIARPVKRDL